MNVPTWTPDRTYPLPPEEYTRRRRTRAIIVHHTAGPEAQLVERIRTFHVRPRAAPSSWVAKALEANPGATEAEVRAAWVPGRGWLDVGYHWLIRQGVAHPGRPEWAVGSHAAGALPSGKIVGRNSDTIGVALVGTYTYRDPPFPQRRALRQLLGELLARYPGAVILRHDQAMAEVGLPAHTTCPGCDWLAPILERLACAGLYP